ncbi:MAG TPA: DUF481 domain-containing protein [Bacteroidales bacterium]|nr:DUF481 domain-containing protein [Bacteroidales bacterium]
MLKTKTVIQLIILIVTIEVQASGQGILNTEKYGQNLGKAFLVAGTFGYEGARGNSNLNKTDFELLTSYHINSHVFRLVGGFNYLNSSGKVITSNIYSQLRYNHVFTNRLQSFTFYQVQKNDILLVKRRELLGAGLRIALVRKDSSRISFDAGIGGMYENELLNRPDSITEQVSANNYFRMSDFLSFRYKHKNIVIVNVMYVQPLVNYFRDFRLYNDLSIQFRIRKNLSFETGFVYRYDSRPPGDLEMTDLNFKNAIIVKF